MNARKRKSPEDKALNELCEFIYDQAQCDRKGVLRIKLAKMGMIREAILQYVESRVNKKPEIVRLHANQKR